MPLLFAMLKCYVDGPVPAVPSGDLWFMGERSDSPGLGGCPLLGLKDSFN